MHNLFCDGGVINANPSPLGGVWAIRWVDDYQVILQASGMITVERAQMPTVSNNMTEMLALVRGLSAVPRHWIGTVCSDSQITLERAFGTWKWKNVPQWLVDEFQGAKNRLVFFDEIKYELYKGHPSKAELAQGFGYHGTPEQLKAGLGRKYPVSINNVLCDHACNIEAINFKKGIRGEPEAL